MSTWQQNYYRRKRAARRHPLDPEYREFSEEERRAYEDAMGDIWAEEVAERRAAGRV